MGWAYIIIRTFPFWAIPTGIALIFGATAKRNPKVKGKGLYLFIGVLLIVGSIAFLVMRGHESAVPFFHQLLTEKVPALRR